MGEKEGDPLDELVIDSGQIDRRRLVDLLRGRVWLDPQARRFVFDPGVRQSTTLQQRIILALLAQKALSLKVEGEELSDAMSPKDFETKLGEKGNSIRPAIKRLADEGLIFSVEGGYTVPAHVMDRLTEVLDNGE